MEIKMRYVSLIILIISVMHQLCEVNGFKNYIVGGATTWRVPDNNDTAFFEQWASSKRFHVGDSLQFKYKNDSVVTVDKCGYYRCDTINGIAYFNDGNTFVKLQHPGMSYFISGFPDHCNDGQLLAIDVMNPHTIPGQAASPESSRHLSAESPGPSQASNSSPQLAPVAHISAYIGLVVATLLLV